jgi:hypothetical protein
MPCSTSPSLPSGDYGFAPAIECIKPFHLQQNGRQGRTHLTLESEATHVPPGGDSLQQRARSMPSVKSSVAKDGTRRSHAMPRQSLLSLDRAP